MTHSPLSEDELREQLRHLLVNNTLSLSTYDERMENIIIRLNEAVDSILTLITAQKETWQREALASLVPKLSVETECDVCMENQDIISERINELKKRGE